MNESMLVIILAIVAGLVYNAYQRKEDEFEFVDHCQLVRDYFVDQSIHPNKPFLWMHVNTELNARRWESFQSRSSTKLNQPYLYITMKSIYDKCEASFNVCLVDDTVFARLIPKWSVAVETLASPVKEHYRELGLASLIYYYGGVSIAPSSLCLKDLYPLYLYGPYIAPNILLAGRKKCPKIREWMQYQQSNLADYSVDSEFHEFKNPIPLLDGIYLGTKNVDHEPILVQHLLGTSPLNVHKDAYVIYLPIRDILNRPAFNWFARMSVEQILNSSLAVSKHIIASY